VQFELHYLDAHLTLTTSYWSHCLTRFNILCIVLMAERMFQKFYVSKPRNFDIIPLVFRYAPKIVLLKWIFSGKNFCCDPNKFSTWLVWLKRYDSFSPLNYDRKVEFWLFSAFSPADESDYGVLEGRYKNTCCTGNYGKIRSYAAAITFYPSKNIYSNLLLTHSSDSRVTLEVNFRKSWNSKLMIGWSSTYNYVEGNRPNAYLQ